MVPEFDLIILGGGCAGLSLALRLAALGNGCPRTLILEQRSVYTNDRTWCFWGEAATPMHDLVQHSWQQVRIRTGSDEVSVDCGDTPYQMITASAFYAEALAAIGRAATIELALGSSVLGAAVRVGNWWQLQSNRGTCRARMVVDTRPGARPATGLSKLWQSFYGHEIECDDACFDPGCVDLMDFSAADTSRVLFTYVLPLSAHHALVEVTQFGPEPLTPEMLGTDLTLAIAARVNGAAFRTVRSEHGILPMGVASRTGSVDATYVHAGLMSGAARPATGYAFQRIQRWALACAASIGAGKNPVGHAADALPLRAMDRLFLSVLAAQPALAPALFLRLFGIVESAALIRFLRDAGTMADYLSIVAALPTAPFLRQIPHALFRPASVVLR